MAEMKDEEEDGKRSRAKTEHTHTHARTHGCRRETQPIGRKVKCTREPQSHEPRVKQQWLGVCRLLATPLCQLCVVTSTFLWIWLMVIAGWSGKFWSLTGKRMSLSLIPQSKRNHWITGSLLIRIQWFWRKRCWMGGFWIAKDSEFLCFDPFSSVRIFQFVNWGRISYLVGLRVEQNSNQCVSKSKASILVYRNYNIISVWSFLFLFFNFF